MTFLLDVNVLIALIDPLHIEHELAHGWFQREGRKAWATCPITENGLVRIICNPKYPNACASPADAISHLASLCALPGHAFWPDSIRINDPLIDPVQMTSHAQLTDTYLLALAASRQAKLATLDRKLAANAVQNGQSTLCVIYK